MQKIKSSNRDFLWLKMNKGFFGNKNDIYVCNCYIPPYNSDMHKDLELSYFDTLRNEIAKFGQMGEVLLVGDFNSRVGEIQELMIDCDNEADSLTSIDGDKYELPYRSNEDPIVNTFGRKLLALLNESNLIIVNGRKLGDRAGNKTCYKYNGTSTVDFMISSKTLFSDILNFGIENQTWYSDHSPFSSALKIGRNLNVKYNSDKLDKISKYVWSDEGKEKYISAIDSVELNRKFETLMANDIADPDTILSDFKGIITSIADSTLPKRYSRPEGKHILKPLEMDLGPNYSKLKAAKQAFKTAYRDMRTMKDNQDRRQKFIIARRQYKRIKYLVFKESKEKRLLKLAKIENSDPKAFWKTVKKIICPQLQPSNDISAQNWVDYFKKLLNIKLENKSQFLDYVKYSLPQIEKQALSPGPVDYEISIKEFDKVLNSAKNGKATGPDKINNEMLKYLGQTARKCLLYVFNQILQSGNYPKCWKLSYITPQFKANDPDDPNNYRGIALADCMSKIFCKILDQRILRFLKDKGYWKINQNGFKEGRRTDDNIFILHALFHKYVKVKRGKLFVAFVDFKKLFDSLNRDALYYKLLESGITGNVYNLIKSAYYNCTLKIKLAGGITHSFESTTGVKQGCSMSPNLSNLFQNDLHDIFQTDCNPVELSGFSFNSVSWADDLFLVSRTQEGLQTCIDKLQVYCDKWGLQVNALKTKCMVMSLGKTAISNMTFSYAEQELDIVESYKYLGVLVTYNWNINKMIQDRINKANRAIFMIKRAISSTQNVSTDLALSMFDKRISPVLLFGCPIWGVPTYRFSIKICVDTIPDSDVKPWLVELLQRFSDRVTGNDIKSYRVYRAKNEIEESRSSEW